MSLFKSVRNLPFGTRLAVGAGIIAWGLAGTYLSDQVEEKLGFTPTERDKAELERMTPKIHVIDRDVLEAGGSGDGKTQS